MRMGVLLWWCGHTQVQGMSDTGRHTGCTSTKPEGILDFIVRRLRFLPLRWDSRRFGLILIWWYNFRSSGHGEYQAICSGPNVVYNTIFRCWIKGRKGHGRGKSDTIYNDILNIGIWSATVV